MVSLGKYVYLDNEYIINSPSCCLCKDSAEKPDIMISGNMMVGQSVTVQCSVYHMCPTNPPRLQLNIPLQSHRLSTTMVPGEVSKTTLMTTMTIERDLQTVDCSARYTGGLTATASKVLNAECT